MGGKGNELGERTKEYVCVDYPRRKEEGASTKCKKAGNYISVISITTEEKSVKPVPMHSRLDLMSQLKRCDSLNTGRKRKAIDTSVDWGRQSLEAVNILEDPITFVAREAMRLVTRCSTELDKRISENPNTKREIKELAANLKKEVEVLGREMTIF